MLEDDGGQFRVILGERREAFQNGDAAAEAAMSLSHFEANGSAADDDQMIELLAIVENRFVGEIGDGVEARDRRHHGR